METSVAEKWRSLLFRFYWWLTDGELLFVYAGVDAPQSQMVTEYPKPVRRDGLGGWGGGRMRREQHID